MLIKIGPSWFIQRRRKTIKTLIQPFWHSLERSLCRGCRLTTATCSVIFNVFSIPMNVTVLIFLRGITHFILRGHVLKVRKIYYRSSMKQILQANIGKATIFLQITFNAFSRSQA